MIKAVIFDIDGVVVDFSWKMYFDYKAEELDVNRKRFAETFLPLKERWDLGRITLGELETKVARSMKISKANVDVLGGFRELARSNVKVRSLIRRLSRKYKVALLTNVGMSRYRVERARYINNLPLNCIVASCYIKAKKPDQRIYRYALSKMRLEPGEAIFVDDGEKNVLAAKRIGMDSILFKNYTQLESALKAREVV